MSHLSVDKHGSASARGTIVAIGVFDGLHLGHRAILERALARARECRGRCVVMSFDPHPDVVLAPSGFHSPPPLTPLGEKRSLLGALGVDAFQVLPFTRELAALEPEAFVDRHLVRPLAPSALVVGEGFALGRGRSGTVARLQTIGIDRDFVVEAVPLVTLDGAPVSSTRIRGQLAEGRVAEAARLLGRRYAFTGTVVTGDGRGRQLGFPTANLRLHEDRQIPGDGIYAVLASVAGEATLRPAAMSIGMRPTFDGQNRTLEVHLIDWKDELVGRDLRVEFVAWLRRELRFDGAEALREAIDRDVAETRRVLAGVVAGPA